MFGNILSKYMFWNASYLFMNYIITDYLTFYIESHNVLKHSWLEVRSFFIIQVTVFTFLIMIYFKHNDAKGLKKGSFIQILVTPLIAKF